MIANAHRRWLAAGLFLLLLGMLLVGGARSRARLVQTRDEPEVVAPSEVAGAPGPPSRSTPRTELQPEMAASRPQDPLLSVIPQQAANAAMIDAEALFALPIGRMLLRCMQPSTAMAGGKRLDLSTVKRLGFAVHDGHILSFMTADPTQLTEQASRGNDDGQYGDRAHRFSMRDEADGGATHAQKYAAVWNRELWVQGDDENAVRAAVDRMEGRAPHEEAISPNEAYGDAYGRLDSAFLSAWLPPEIAEKVRDASARFEFHLDASDGVHLVINAAGELDAVRAVGRSIATMLDEMRERARARNDVNAQRVVDTHTLRDAPDGFQLEAWFPMELVADLMGECARGDRDDE